MRKLRKQKGFTLVETIVALLILTIALLAFAQIPALYSKLMSMSVEKENATLYAIEALDLIETLDYDTEITSTMTSSDIGFEHLPPGYDVSAVVSDDSSSKTVTVTVSINSGVGKKDVSLTRVVSPFADKTAE